MTDVKWSRGDRSKKWGLSRLWQASNGCSIWQGRISNDMIRTGWVLEIAQPLVRTGQSFVYRLEAPTGRIKDFRLLKDAKQAGTNWHAGAL